MTAPGASLARAAPPIVRDPPADVHNEAAVAVYSLECLAYGPDRLRAVAARLQFHKDAHANADRSLKLRKAALRLQLASELERDQRKTNEAQRDAMLEERAHADPEARALIERLEIVSGIISETTIELTYERDRLDAARAIARLLNMGRE